MDTDNDLIYTNRFIKDPGINAGYGMTSELRKQKLKDKMAQELPEAPEQRELTEQDFMKTNPVITDEGKPRENGVGSRAVLKEVRSVITVDSSQRAFFSTEDLELDDEATFESYFSTADYVEFRKLWRLLAGVQQELATYREYAAENEVSITSTGSSSDTCRDLIRNLVLSRSVSFGQDNSEVNQELLKLLVRIADVNSFSGNLAIVNSLNAYAMSAAAVNPEYFWRPFFYDTTEEKAKIITYNEQHPNSYRITLPRIINHVKSIRLLSTEIPNTINNITERNNLLTLSLRYKGASDLSVQNGVIYRPVELDTTRALFNFILIKLDIGSYSIDTLLDHLQTKINETVALQTSRRFGSLFTITWKQTTGKVEIKCNKSDLEFHLKFYSRLTEQQKIYDAQGVLSGYTHGIITDYSHDLWYMLGFPWPYEINVDTTDKYTQTLTNQVGFGSHQEFQAGHANNDIFDRSATVTDYLGDTLDYAVLTSQDNITQSRFDQIRVERPYRYPSVDFKYIYLVLKGYKSMDHMNQHNVVVEFTDRDFFAKIQMDTDTGKIAFNSFVSNPLIFTNAIDKIDSLDVMWVDERGDLVDFGKVNHSFTLEFIHYITQNDVNGYDTKLGFIDTKSYPEYLNSSK